MQEDSGLSVEVVCLGKERVLLSLRSGSDHSASVDMDALDALRLAQVLTCERHGCCPDTWLVERMAGTETLWLTLSSASRGFVRISRIEISERMAEQLAGQLTCTAEKCTLLQTAAQPMRRVVVKWVRTMARLAAQHTRPLNHQRKQGLRSLHRSMLFLYRSLGAFDRTEPNR
ncbi:hypothetical protein [uncultured Sphaerotilus sp.]|uniref:hypothetical protein n=1 Tax=uncultured Sphaerotilus sp. TaxID=474984 RepID=UPI0030CA1F88